MGMECPLRTVISLFSVEIRGFIKFCYKRVIFVETNSLICIFLEFSRFQIKLNVADSLLVMKSYREFRNRAKQNKLIYLHLLEKIVITACKQITYKISIA